MDRSLALYIQDRDAGTQLDQGLGLDNNDPVVKFGPLEIKKKGLELGKRETFHLFLFCKSKRVFKVVWNGKAALWNGTALFGRSQSHNFQAASPPAVGEC